MTTSTAITPITNRFKNVIDANGDHRVALIQDGTWVSISRGVTSIDKDVHEEAQCDGHWLDGTPVTDAETGETYPPFDWGFASKN